MRSVAQDVRYGVRVLRKNPGLTALAVLALGLGIGANTAVFSVCAAFLWHPVSFPGVDRIVMVMNRTPESSGLDWNEISPADYLDWSRQSRSFNALSSFEFDDVNLTGAGEPEKLTASLVSADFFSTLQSPPVLGRAFRPEENQPGRDQEVILSHALWHRSFGGAPDVIGEAAEIDGRSYTIVGVMDKDFDFPPSAQLWLPMTLSAKEQSVRDTHYVSAVARLRPGVTMEQAQAEMSAIGRRLEEQYPDTDKGWTVWVFPVAGYVAGFYGQQYSRLALGAVFFVLLIACANVANLLLARGASRQREIALRSALGASRWRVIRQLLTESVLLALGGCALGLVLGNWGIQIIRAYMPAEVEKYLPFWHTIRLDREAFLFSLGAAVLAGIFAGIAPALTASKPDVIEQLKDGARGSASGRGAHRLRSVFVISEIALSLVLLIGAGLMAKGVLSLTRAERSLAPESLLTFSVQLPDSKYKSGDQQSVFYGRMLEGIESVPGVKSATLASSLPYGSHISNFFRIQGKPFEPGAHPTAYIQRISPAFFRTLHIPLRSGREFGTMDAKDSPRVAIVSEDLVHRYLADENPIGMQIKTGTEDSADPWTTIVGVAAPVRYYWSNRVEDPAIYFPYAQAPHSWSHVVIRAAGDPLALVPSLRARIGTVDPDQPIFDVATEAKVVHNSLLGLAYVAVLLLVFGAMALLLAAIGVYGVMSYAASERTHEIGVRMALGAEPRSIFGLVLRRGTVLAAIGFLIGLPAAFALARLVSSLLFGVGAADGFIFSAATFMLAAVAVLACYVPARRAMRVDPMVALRYE